MKVKANKGITLIVLIITTIVLLILAGITILTLTGENGILNKAETSKETTELKAVEEQVKMAIMASYDANGQIDFKKLKENINNIEGVTEITDDIIDESFPLNVTVKGQVLELSKKGNTITVVSEGVSNPGTPEVPPTENPGTEEPPVVEVTGVALNKEETTLGKGAQETLQVTITPEDATNKDITCTSSDENVAIVEIGEVASISEIATIMPVTVVAEGTKTIPVKVTAIGEGTATITVKTISGEKLASCVVTVESEIVTQAKAAMPVGASIKSGTTEETGIVMVDSNENEWVWIEVPDSIYSEKTKNDPSNDNIKADLITYATDYRGSTSDTYYSGCGISSTSEYTKLYNKMLSSVYTNKGFYISRYEAGIEGSDTDISKKRTSRAEITSSSPKAVSKKNMIPYNYVYCSDAQILASNMTTGDKTSSLLFGIQWDLVCKYLEEKSDLEKSDIKSDSMSWGNYSNSSLILERGKYNISPGSTSSEWKTYDVDTLNYVTLSKTSTSTSYDVLLTTGASEGTKKMNIYDLAGNVWERTLEKTANTSYPCAIRGGSYYHTGSDYPASYCYSSNTTGSSYDIAFRASLY